MLKTLLVRRVGSDLCSSKDGLVEGCDARKRSPSEVVSTRGEQSHEGCKSKRSKPDARFVIEQRVEEAALTR